MYINKSVCEFMCWLAVFLLISAYFSVSIICVCCMYFGYNNNCNCIIYLNCELFVCSTDKNYVDTTSYAGCIT